MNNRQWPAILAAIWLANGCASDWRAANMKDSESASIKGAELSIRCPGLVKEKLYVDIWSGQFQESFGIISAGPNGREGGKTTGFSPMEISKGLTVRWGIKGEDGLKKEHRAHFDLSGQEARMKAVKAVVLVYSGNGKWRLDAYDQNISEDNKRLLFTLTPGSPNVRP